MASQTVENYIKKIYLLSQNESIYVSTSAVSESTKTAAASVTDMLKKLADQKLIEYIKYKGVRLTPEGKSMALRLIRKHRLWETFLHETLNINWDEVHDIAEQLEHVKSDILIDKIDDLLHHPKFDPHGDPIPDKTGKFTFRSQKSLGQAQIGESLKIVAVKDHSSSFLKYLDSIPLSLDQTIVIKNREEFDQSVLIEINGSNQKNLSIQAAEKILVKPIAL